MIPSEIIYAVGARKLQLPKVQMYNMLIAFTELAFKTADSTYYVVVADGRSTLLYLEQCSMAYGRNAVRFKHMNVHGDIDIAIGTKEFDVVSVDDYDVIRVMREYSQCNKLIAYEYLTK